MIAYFALLADHDYGYQPVVGDECQIRVGDRWFRVMFAGAALGAFWAAPLENGLRQGDVISGIREVELS